MEDSTVVVELVYNPFVLHLLYVKMRYLRRLVMRHYRRYTEGAVFVDYCILNDWYTEIVTKDLEVMQATMDKERFPMPLYHSHYEYYLFRLSHVLSTPGDAYDELYGGRRFECETSALKVVDQDHYKLKVQSLIHDYIVAFYFAANGNTEKRIELLFGTKHTLEKEIGESMIDKENMEFFVNYDKELCATLFYIHLVDEMLSLREKEMATLNHEPVITKYKFKKRKLHKEGATLYNRKDEGDMTLCILNKLLLNLCQSFRQQIVERTKYYQKPKEEESTSWFSTTKTVVVFEPAKKAHLLNHVYLLDRPHEECLIIKSPPSIGRSSFYRNAGLGQNQTCSVRYIAYCSENRVHYVQILYRLVFELFLREKHRCPHLNSACYFCSYYTRGTNNKKVAQFLTLCEEQIEEPDSLQGRIHSLNVELEKLYIERAPALTLCSYKTLANVFCLFECFPLLLEGKEACHSLLSVINPVEMLRSLSSTVILSKLELKMCEILKLCRAKIGLLEEEEGAIVIIREQALAMDIELVRLLNQAIVTQQNEIIRYERSISTTKVAGIGKTLSTEISRVLEKIYMAHIDILCQVMLEKRQSVTFDT